MERRTFIIGIAGGAWFAALWAAYNKWAPVYGPTRVGVEQYLQFGERAALEALTPNEVFYITSKGSTPKVDANEWRLSVSGLVETPLSLSLDEVKALPAIERTLTLECISNRIGGPWIGNAVWRGTPLRPLLEKASPRAEAVSALLHGADGLSSGIPLERLLAEDNFLAYEMNGKPLSPAHGFPMRVFLPGKYGMKQPKWLTGIQFTPEHKLGFWERRGWSDTAERQTRTVTDTPRAKARLIGDRFLLAGYAVADASGIRRVEVSTDDGETWQPAEIVSNPSPYVWTFWKYEWAPPGPGSYKLRARAVNGRGELQTGEETDPNPEGATGYHRIAVEVA